MEANTCKQLTLTTHGALAFGRVLFYPLEDAVLFVVAGQPESGGRESVNQPCESCDRISRTLGTYAP